VQCLDFQEAHVLSYPSTGLQKEVFKLSLKFQNYIQTLLLLNLKTSLIFKNSATYPNVFFFFCHKRKQQNEQTNEKFTLKFLTHFVL
jgi:hypothetical protein